MTATRRALAYLALSTFFAAALLSTRAMDAPPAVIAAAAWGLGASMVESVVWWRRRGA